MFILLYLIMQNLTLENIHEWITNAHQHLLNYLQTAIMTLAI